MDLLCIDGNSVLNRAFYGIHLLTTKDGFYTNAVYGFMNILLRLVEQYEPDAVAVAFDVRAKTFRHEMYDKYKATRKGMPEELASQLPVLQSLLTALGYKIVTCEGYEADDILGTFSRVCAEHGDGCYIATGDRDSLQLAGNGTEILLTTTKMGHGETTPMNEKEVFEKYGVTPAQFVDLKALMGDSSDNIPGVAGVGEKTATALIARFGSLDGVYANLESPEIKDGVRKKLEADKAMAYLSQKLAEINKNVPIDTELAHYQKQQGDPAEAARILARLEMHSTITKLGLQAVEQRQDEFKKAPAEEKELLMLEANSAKTLEDMCIALGDNGVVAASADEAYSTDKDSLRALFASDRAKSAYNSKALYHIGFDLGCELRGIEFDLLLAAYLLNPLSANYKIENLAAEYGVDALYEAKDAGLPAGALVPLCAKLSALLEARGMKKLHDEIELPLSRVLAKMEREGFLVDTKGIKEFGTEMDGVIERELGDVYDLAGRKFNLNSPKQLGEILFDVLRLPAGKKTKSGYSTNAEVLEKLRYEHPIVEHILRYRTYAKLKSTYVEGLLKAADANGVIHTDFIQTETRTGRISSREPNLQNIPVRTELGSRLRRYFVAPEGYVLLDADYSQIELRVLASLSEDERMKQAFSDKRDIHTETAAQIFRLPREMVTSEFRRRAKAVNFGIVYGIGAFSLARDVGVSVREASEYIDNYLATYSGIDAFLKATVESAQQNGYVTTLFGRRRALPELANSNKNIQALGKRLAMNTPIQGTAADIIKIAMIRVSDRLQAEKLDAKLILQVHDELIVCASEKDADAAARVLKDEMENAVHLSVPLVAEVGRGVNWYDAK